MCRLSALWHLLYVKKLLLIRRMNFPFFKHNSRASLDSTRNYPGSSMDLLSDSPDTSEKREMDDEALASVVQIFSTSTSSTYTRPWARNAQMQSTGSGFVVQVGDTKMIITNYHVIRDATRVTVEKRGDDEKYDATILAQDCTCDLALLSVESDAFWKSCGKALVPTKELPSSGEECWVIGFPHGGTSASVTRGICSRLELTNYLELDSVLPIFGRVSRLLCVQVDAAINPGNSGGPALNNDKQILGVAFASLVGSEGYSFLIPWEIVNHFIVDVMRNGQSTGFPVLPFSYQLLANPDMRESLGMRVSSKSSATNSSTAAAESGILITSVCNYNADSTKEIRVGDIVLELDGRTVSNQGRVLLQQGGSDGGVRIELEHIVSQKYVGDSVKCLVLRDGKRFTVKIKLNETCNSMMLVPSYLEPGAINHYVIVGGLVFLIARGDLVRHIDMYGSFSRMLSTTMQKEFLFGLKEQSDQELVVLAEILDDKINSGYKEHICLPSVVNKFNNIRINNLKHLFDLVQSCKDKYYKFEIFERSEAPSFCVMDRKSSIDANKHIMEVHCISKASSYESDT